MVEIEVSKNTEALFLLVDKEESSLLCGTIPANVNPAHHRNAGNL